MIGSGRDGTGERINHWEYMRIERGADGALTFYGSPKGAPAVGFKATAASDQQITFVNAGHDYPQRIRYVATPTGIDAETAHADGTKPQRWHYRRPGSPPK